MYYVMDAHSFFSFIYFILLIVIGSFFMLNLWKVFNHFFIPIGRAEGLFENWIKFGRYCNSV